MINLMDEHKKVIDFTRIHCHFHYQASYEYYNLASILFRQEKYEDAILNIDKSINLYRHNVDSFYLKGMILHIKGRDESKEYLENAIKFNRNYDKQYKYTQQEILNYDDNHSFNPRIIDNRNTELETSVEIENFYAELMNACDLNQSSDIASEIISQTASLHFGYHIDLAKMYFNIGDINYGNGNFYEAIFFLEKALECDAKNPENEKYRDFIKQIRILVN
jgi:tetratricopeptide (TPR) repeat protein